MPSLGDSWRETKRVFWTPACQALARIGVMFDTPQQLIANTRRVVGASLSACLLSSLFAVLGLVWLATTAPRPDVVSCGPLPPDLPPIASFRGHRHTSQTSHLAVFEKGLRPSPWKHYLRLPLLLPRLDSSLSRSAATLVCEPTYSTRAFLLQRQQRVFFSSFRVAFPFTLLLPPPSPPCLSVCPSTASKATTCLGNGRNRSCPASDGLFSSLLACYLALPALLHVSNSLLARVRLPLFSSPFFLFPCLLHSHLSSRVPNPTHSFTLSLRTNHLARCRSGRRQEKPAPLPPDRSSSSSSSSAQPTHERRLCVDGMGWAGRAAAAARHIFYLLP
ncbi:hypothetical protein IWX90DRAFT_294788 [Phyllosticta citrichinensis]|uniref:Transmembrane protein n=1 Tax=Phyllosticta citrichinensis TaxID=1130410 RepID=A0ABR1XKB8_9PEZI